MGKEGTLQPFLGAQCVDCYGEASHVCGTVWRLHFVGNMQRDTSIGKCVGEHPWNKSATTNDTRTPASLVEYAAHHPTIHRGALNRTEDAEQSRIKFASPQVWNSQASLASLVSGSGFAVSLLGIQNSESKENPNVRP